MLVDASAQRDLLTLGRANRRDERNLSEVGAHRRDAAARRGRANVDHEDLALGELLHLARLLALGGLDAKQAPQQVVAHLQLGVNLRQVADRAEHLAD
eukprot:scaffold109653_cov78-Phaeocystis_antarctica.AAC.4